MTSERKQITCKGTWGVNKNNVQSTVWFAQSLQFFLSLIPSNTYHMYPYLGMYAMAIVCRPRRQESSNKVPAFTPFLMVELSGQFSILLVATHHFSCLKSSCCFYKFRSCFFANFPPSGLPHVTCFKSF